MTVPTTREGVLDPDWLQGALSDISDDDRIVTVEAVDTSKTLAEKLRFAATVEASDGTRRVRAYCAKGHLDGSPGGDIIPEALFYRDLAPRLDVRMPAVYFADVDDAAGQAIIVMEDVVASGGRFLSAREPYAIETTRDTLSQLARLHAATWGGAPTGDLPWLGPRVGMFGSLFPVEALQALFDDGRSEGIEPALRDGANLLAALRASGDREITCVLHGDTHSGNSYLDADGRTCWLDWQVVQTGNWSTDISYHLATVLSIEDRRAHEEELLRHYLAELESLGAPAPAWDEAWELYRSGFPYGYLLWVITRISSREVVLLHMPRIAAAMKDHETYRRLGVL